MTSSSRIVINSRDVIFINGPPTIEATALPHFQVLAPRFSQTFHNALNIRKSPIFGTRADFLASDNYLLNELKDQNIPLENFKALMNKTIEEYYEADIDEVVAGKLNHAEFLQLLAIIFYETSANAMIIKSWKN